MKEEEEEEEKRKQYPYEIFGKKLELQSDIQH
jgi:hypothetical protein